MKSKLWLLGLALALLFWPAFGQTSHYITISWLASSTSGVAYNVYRSTSATGTFTKINTSDVTALTYNDTTGVGGTTYFYFVTAVCDATTSCPAGISGESVPSQVSAGATFLASPVAPAAAPTVQAH